MTEHNASHTATLQKFRNFWSNVSSVRVENNVSQETLDAIVKALSGANNRA